MVSFQRSLFQLFSSLSGIPLPFEDFTPADRHLYFKEQVCFFIRQPLDQHHLQNACAFCLSCILGKEKDHNPGVLQLSHAILCLLLQKDTSADQLKASQVSRMVLQFLPVKILCSIKVHNTFSYGSFMCLFTLNNHNLDYRANLYSNLRYGQSH